MLIRGMITVMYAMICGCTLLIILFILLCMNIFTLPIYVLLYLICRLLKLNRPKIRMYGVMLYPSWSQEPRFTLSNTLSKWAKREERKAREKERKRFCVTHAWEERFFY